MSWDGAQCTLRSDYVWFEKLASQAAAAACEAPPLSGYVRPPFTTDIMITNIELENWNVVLLTIGTLVAIVGFVWQLVSYFIKNPKLRVTLLDPRSQLTRFGESQDAPLTHFYHLNVKNSRNSTANDVHTKLTSITREAVRAEQRSWVFFVWVARPKPKIYLLDIPGLDEQACNLGYIIQGQDFFSTSVIQPLSVRTISGRLTSMDSFAPERQCISTL